jgi:hypothetical protein
MLVIDIYLIWNYSGRAAPDVGWWKLTAALLIQLFVFLVARIREAFIRYKVKVPSDTVNISYRNYVPYVFIGFAIAALALSTTLLEIAIVCPHQHIPAIRGVAVCT